MTERIYKVSCIDGRLYLNHHGVSDYVGDEDCTNEKAIIEIGQYLNELTHENEQLKKENKFLRCKIESDSQDDYIYYLKKQNERLKERIKELEKENENQNNILEDFMLMLNRLQAEPNNKLLQSMARDMLRLMGKNIMSDFE